jgi:hypothetical protein
VKGWQRLFEDIVVLPEGRQFITLEDAGNYITKLPKAEHRARVAGGNGGSDARRHSRWPDEVRAHRRHEGLEPPRRPRVQSRPQGSSLGEAQVGARSVTDSDVRFAADTVGEVESCVGPNFW